MELDLLVDLAREVGLAGGVFGSRMTGGGFGGSTVSLVKRELVDDISQRITEQYNGDSRTSHQATAFHTHPTAGAHLIKRPQH